LARQATPRRSHGEKIATDGGVAAAVPQRKVRANVNAVRVIATVHIILSLLCREQKTYANGSLSIGVYEKERCRIYRYVCTRVHWTGRNRNQRDSGSAITHAGISLPFRLVVLARIYPVSDISDAPLNPAVSLFFCGAPVA